LTNLSLSRLTNPHPTTSSLHAAFATVAAAAAAAAASSATWPPGHPRDEVDAAAATLILLSPAGPGCAWLSGGPPGGAVPPHPHPHPPSEWPATTATVLPVDPPVPALTPGGPALADLSLAAAWATPLVGGLDGGAPLPAVASTPAVEGEAPPAAAGHTATAAPPTAAAPAPRGAATPVGRHAPGRALLEISAQGGPGWAPPVLPLRCVPGLAASLLAAQAAPVCVHGWASPSAWLCSPVVAVAGMAAVAAPPSPVTARAVAAALKKITKGGRRAGVGAGAGGAPGRRSTRKGRTPVRG